MAGQPGSGAAGAVLMLLVGLALVGNTIVGGLPDKVLSLGKVTAATPTTTGAGAAAAAAVNQGAAAVGTKAGATAAGVVAQGAAAVGMSKAEGG